ncbi:MAG: aggregation promoting factor surface protein [Lactobacillus sp.]|nr:aggregation promoting factor surface protein [Lactobacillus sp.]
MSKYKAIFTKLLIALTLTVGLGSTVIEATPVHAAKKMSKAEKRAKNWIAMRESGGSYTARNGVCYGRYQLSISYLHGNLSAKNQEKVANRYVKGRYGSWVKAKKFWLTHHWY